MKFLEAGTLRFLLISDEEVARNYQRRAARGSTVVVAEENPEAPGSFINHEGFGAMTDGPVAFVYEPTGSVAQRRDHYTGRRLHQRAAYATYGRIAIAEDAEEAESLVLTMPEPLGTSDSPDDGAQTAAADSTTTTTEAPAAAESKGKRPSTKQPKVSKPAEEGSN